MQQLFIDKAAMVVPKLAAVFPALCAWEIAAEVLLANPPPSPPLPSPSKPLLCLPESRVVHAGPPTNYDEHGVLTTDLGSLSELRIIKASTEPLPLIGPAPAATPSAAARPIATVKNTEAAAADVNGTAKHSKESIARIAANGISRPAVVKEPLQSNDGLPCAAKASLVAHEAGTQGPVQVSGLYTQGEHKVTCSHMRCHDMELAPPSTAPRAKNIWHESGTHATQHVVCRKHAAEHTRQEMSLGIRLPGPSVQSSMLSEVVPSCVSHAICFIGGVSTPQLSISSPWCRPKVCQRLGHGQSLRFSCREGE